MVLNAADASGRSSTPWVDIRGASSPAEPESGLRRFSLQMDNMPTTAGGTHNMPCARRNRSCLASGRIRNVAPAGRVGCPVSSPPGRNSALGSGVCASTRIRPPW